MFLLLNRKEGCVVKIKISLFVITKQNVSLMTCDYVIINLTKVLTLGCQVKDGVVMIGGLEISWISDQRGVGGRGSSLIHWRDGKLKNHEFRVNVKKRT